MTSTRLLCLPEPFLQCVKYATAPQRSIDECKSLITALANVILQSNPPPSLSKILTVGAIACIVPSMCLVNYFLSDTDEDRAESMREFGIGFAATCTSCIAYTVAGYTSPITPSQKLQLARNISLKLFFFSRTNPLTEQLKLFCDRIQQDLEHIPESPPLHLLSQILQTSGYSAPPGCTPSAATTSQHVEPPPPYS